VATRAVVSAAAADDDVDDAQALAGAEACMQAHMASTHMHTLTNLP